MGVSEGEAFLQAIFKRPEDVTARLVYADWLDEHDHPGGELIRLRQQLVRPDLPGTKRSTLAAREREVLAKCDRDWLVQLERADWKLRYIQVRPADEGAAQWAKRRKGLWSAPAQKAMSRALAAFEEEVGLPLPVSWKAFAHGCGPGYLCGDYIGIPRKGSGDVTRFQREWSGWRAATQAQIDERYPYMDADVRSWIRNSVRFGTGDNGDYLVWNTSRITDPVRAEYEVVLLYARGCDRLTTYESFEAMWNANVEQRRSDDGDEAKPFYPD
ncbi:TIGR02996 domain-containing protein [Gemmata sp. JC717]|uniref:TIGR02996 domain-containing protein n=1 Tax=Gemmata algarum TaxID=2975278 RepID=UPI0021BB6808|nr:TIGR02996 domain-containing protein [Gemmata algarum]MDY3554395.1 TIGR02996 domain-containing protein [Gemmata algarum]